MLSESCRDQRGPQQQVRHAAELQQRLSGGVEPLELLLLLPGLDLTLDTAGRVERRGQLTGWSRPIVVPHAAALDPAGRRIVAAASVPCLPRHCVTPHQLRL